MRKNIDLLLLFLLINSLIVFASGQSITEIQFTSNEKKLKLEGQKEFSYIANYDIKSNNKYLFIYTTNFEDKMYYNKAIYKIYFKVIPDKDSVPSDKLNYLNSDYSSIEFNSGLFINISNLKYNTAFIFVQSDEVINIWFKYKYANEIIFPEFSQYSNFQLNQFILPKGEERSILYIQEHDYNDYLIILSKTSLRNIDVSVKYKKNDVTDKLLAKLYPNGCSVFADREIFELDDTTLNVNIKNINDRDEVLLLGYMHHFDKQIFPNEIVNGFQAYIEGNNNYLDNLIIKGNSQMKQYFIYQIYEKDLAFQFFSSNADKGRYYTFEYNSVFPYKVDYTGRIDFSFDESPKRSGLYFQYLDYSANNIAQKNLQSLVTGVPKSMFIPEGKSMYHFLPKERDSSNLFFYLRSKSQETIFVSFITCDSYPQNCEFSGKGEKAVEAISNVGLWYSLPRDNNALALQLIYVYCEKDCAYDIIMRYEESDQLFLFPENDYTKFIGNSGSDIFALPVLEYFEHSNMKSINIELTTINGNAELTLKDSIKGNTLNYEVKKIGNRKSISINSDIFLKQSYYKKEIYAVVTNHKNYKNTIYNIMYGSGSTVNTKFLSNKIVNIDKLIVPESQDNLQSKIFTFINNKNDDLYISISTQYCKSKISINNTAKADQDYNHLYNLPKGSSDIKIDLINDGNLCKANFEDEIKLFAYYPNDNVLLSENTLLNSTIAKNISFIHIFKPNTADNDCSLNIELEKLNEIPVTFSYELKKVSFESLNNAKSSGLTKNKLNSRKIRYISNKEINKVCSSLKEYEVCQLTMNFEPSSSSTLSTPSKFSLNINTNGRYISKKLYNSNLISSVNAKTAQYFYIDIIKNNNIELLINSYGQDVKIHYELKTAEKEDSDILPLKESFSSGSNKHQIQIEKSQFSKCNDFCRLYIGVISSLDKNEEEISSIFSIGYHYYNDEKKSLSDIYLPLNYWTQYTFNNLKEIKFYLLNQINKAKLTFELYEIKQNINNNNSVITATIEGGATLELTSDNRKVVTGSLDKIDITIKSSDANSNPTFRFRVSSIGTQSIVPLISSYEEKCLESSPCYYLLDDFVLENQEQSAYFYIPTSETSVINYLDLSSNDEINTEGTYSSSVEDFKRSNWYKYNIQSKNHSLIIKIEKGTLCTSFYNKPNEVTLNYGEKRMFTIRRGSTSSETIKIKINRSSKDNSKYIINLHAVRGNGYLKSQNNNYALGFENAYKEDITIIFQNDNKYDMILEAINQRFDKVDNNNDFVFTIEYKIDTENGLKYPIEFDKMNSFNFYKSSGFEEFSFYLDRKEITSQGLDMNIKIYSSSYYDIKSYFADSNKNCKTDSNDLDNKIKTFIQGGSFSFSKLEVTSDVLGKNSITDYPYIYIQIIPKDKSSLSNSVQIDLYPYDMINTKHYLARDELYIQKLPSNTVNYQLFLGKSETNYGDDAKIYFMRPLSDKYKKAIAQTDDGKTIITEDEPDLVASLTDETYGFYKYSINLATNKKQKYLSFNIYTDENNRESNEDSFIFTYQNPRNGEDYLYWPDKLEFNVTGKEKRLEFGVIGFKPKYETTGTNIFIINAYKEDDIKNCLDLGHDHLSLYLLFNKKPAYTIYQELTLNSETGTKKKIEDTKIKAGKYYFTGVSILKDNGREQYIGYPGKSYEVDSSSLFGELLDYMKNHVFASILIIIIILFILGIMVNICRAERRGGRVSSVKVELDGQLMDDKGDS